MTDTPAADEPRYLIEPPPGLLPPAPVAPGATPHADGDSGTVKYVPSRDAVPARPPVATGIPFAAPPVGVDHADDETVIATPPPAVPHADDETVIASSRAQRTPGWRLSFGDGTSRLVDAPLVLGRRPVAPASHPTAVALPIADPRRSMSKSHALIEVDADGLWLTDLGSTNGTFLTRPGDVLRQLDAHVRTAVPADSDIEVGECNVQVARG